MAESNCRGCGAPIIWIKTNRGENMPCDPQETVIITRMGAMYRGYQSHFATCPNADEFRRSKMTEADRWAERRRKEREKNQ